MWVKEATEVPKTIQALVNPFGCLLELKDKIILWKRPHILVVRYRDNRLVLGSKLPPCWLALKPPKGTEWVAVGGGRGKTPLVLLSYELLGPEFQKAGEDMPTGIRGFTVVGITSCPLIGFEACSTGK